MNNNLNYNKPSGVQKLTLLEQLRKGNDIQVKFLNVKEGNALEDLQMAVFPPVPASRSAFQSWLSA